LLLVLESDWGVFADSILRKPEVTDAILAFFLMTARLTAGVA
jgi:hypothetical protein